MNFLTFQGRQAGVGALCAVSAGSCLVLGVYGVGSDVEQGNYKTAALGAGMLLFGGRVSGLGEAGTRITTDIIATPQGLVNVRATLDRISAGGSFPHRNDGSIFRNLEELLPKKPDGYYREYVHPTPGVGGPGAQRIIRGNDGDLYYSQDHYKTFVTLN